MSDRSSAPSPAASLREQIARLENVAIAVQDLGRAWAHASDKIEAYREVLALIDALPALREAAAPQVKGQHLLNPDSRLVNDPAFRFFILNFGCRSLGGTEDAFACAGCQEDYSALRERIMAADPAQVDVEPIHCLDCPRPEECGGVVDPVKVALVQATRRPAQVDAKVGKAIVEAQEAASCYGYASGGAEILSRHIGVLIAALRAHSASPAPAPIITREKVLAILHDAASDVDAADKIVRCVALASMIRAAEEDGLYDRPEFAASSPAPTQPEGSET